VACALFCDLYTRYTVVVQSLYERFQLAVEKATVSSGEQSLDLRVAVLIDVNSIYSVYSQSSQSEDPISVAPLRKTPHLPTRCAPSHDYLQL
jgi:hypothetical protein